MRRILVVLLMLAAAVGAVPAPARAAHATTVTNFDSAGNQVVRFDTQGNAVDAHDGQIALFGGVYYLYGTAYDCGYQWNADGSPFCGFKVYSSPDLVRWTDRGYLFDPTSSTWQTRCNGTTYGCYRPHVVYNAATQRYVLWINVYDNRVGFRVFTATAPTGPFVETAEPTLAVNSDAPPAGLNNGDHTVFVDDDGAAYVAYTDWRSGGDIVVERLDGGYLTGTGAHTRLGQPATEAPALFRRGGTYYLTYSDPNRGYATTGTSYKSAASPLGPWSAGTNLTTTSCGGQPAFVAPIPTASGTAYLYGSDLWNNGAPNEALANYFWAPLSFDAAGAIRPITCPATITLDLPTRSTGAAQTSPDQDQSGGLAGYRPWCDIGRNIARVQTFVPSRSGTLTSATYTTFQNGSPDAGLEMQIVTADESFRPTGSPLFRTVVPPHSVGWSPRAVTIRPDLAVTAGVRYGIVVRSATTTGCYGLVHNDAAPYPGGGEAYSSDSGVTFRPEAGRTTKFETTISARTPLPTTALPAGWTVCAGEHGVCSVARTGMIAYGAPGGYVYRSVRAGSVQPCTIAGFGGDPLFGTVKSCSVAPAGGPQGYSQCATLGGVCVVTGTRTVAYGINGAYRYREVTGSAPCTNARFGNPIRLVEKRCYVSP
ncbi:family 43 glycosylhydrolase [Actinoplanes sp. NPDC089786]|uniref:family 43 glycosylhydrolase n=1 Tax=Actinoplanes sp. NPDC089786 TaxID=3155185 RepID=UPI0034121C19